MLLTAGPHPLLLTDTQVDDEGAIVKQVYWIEMIPTDHLALLQALVDVLNEEAPISALIYGCTKLDGDEWLTALRTFDLYGVQVAQLNTPLSWELLA